MLNNSNDLTFTYTGGYKDISVISVIFGWESVGGKVEEDINFNLIENWQNYRVTIDIALYLDSTESLWFVENYLKATDKRITIDSVIIPVVLSNKHVVFKHLKKRNFKAVVNLKFKHKAIGALPDQT